MGHTSTLKGSAELLLMVPNTSHKKVMKPSHRSTSDCWSCSRQAKSTCGEVEGREKEQFRYIFGLENTMKSDSLSSFCKCVIQVLSRR